MSDELLNAVGSAPYSFEVELNANSNKNENVELDSFEINVLSQQSNFAFA